MAVADSNNSTTASSVDSNSNAGDATLPLDHQSNHFNNTKLLLQQQQQMMISQFPPPNRDQHGNGGYAHMQLIPANVNGGGGNLQRNGSTGEIGSSASASSGEGFKRERDIRELAELLSYLYPMAEEFIPNNNYGSATANGNGKGGVLYAPNFIINNNLLPMQPNNFRRKRGNFKRKLTDEPVMLNRKIPLERLFMSLMLISRLLKKTLQLSLSTVDK